MKTKNEPKPRSRTRSHHEAVLPIKDDRIVHINDLVGDRHTSTSASEKHTHKTKQKQKETEET